jgi:hypothetical protein
MRPKGSRFVVPDWMRRANAIAGQNHKSPGAEYETSTLLHRDLTIHFAAQDQQPRGRCAGNAKKRERVCKRWVLLIDQARLSLMDERHWLQAMVPGLSISPEKYTA